MSEKSDPEYVPDEAEPDENKPDAWGSEGRWVCDPGDSFMLTAPLRIVPGAAALSLPLWQFEGWHDGKLQVAIPGIGAIRLTQEQAVNFAHAILAEVEIAQKEER